MAFRKFGDIESIEVLPNKEFQAHIIFVSDRSAYLAQLQHDYDVVRSNSSKFTVEPAYSWEQPAEYERTTEDMRATGEDRAIEDGDGRPLANQYSSTLDGSNGIEPISKMSMLNEDCLLHLFSFFDLDSLISTSKVCKLFHRLVNKHFFPRHKQLSVNAISTHFAKLRQTLLCIGRYITDLKFHSSCPGRRSNRYLQLLGETIGSNIRRVQIKCHGVLENNSMALIQPILERLETLELEDYREYSTDFNFRETCPNLVELRLHVSIPFTTCRGRWKHLQRLSLLHNELIRTHTLLIFIQNNPQLIEIGCNVVEDDIIFSSIAENLPMLQKGVFSSPDAELGAWNLHHFKSLAHLADVEFIGLGKEHLSSIIDGLATLRNLQRVSLDLCRSFDDPLNAILVDPEEDEELDLKPSLLDLARLPHLEHVSLYNVPINQSILINFVRHARQLQILHIHYCKVEFKDEFILDMVEVLKDRQSQLKLYFNPADYIYVSVTRKEEVRRHLLLSGQCKHFGF